MVTNTPGRKAMRVGGTADALLWGGAAILSLIAIWLPNLLGPDATQLVQLIVVESALFATGVLCGCIRRERTWRWAVAALVALVFRDVAPILAGHGFHGGALSELTNVLQANAAIYCLRTLTVLLGALAGSVILRAGLD